MTTEQNELLLKILKLGLLEIRLISSTAGDQDCARINKLANILHNILIYMLKDENFNFEGYPFRL